jgi:hypothetical protein
VGALLPVRDGIFHRLESVLRLLVHGQPADVLDEPEDGLLVPVSVQQAAR